MNILVIGGGGREHALAWSLARSSRISRIYVAPGNAGTSQEIPLYNIDITDIEALADFAEKEKIAITVVGPEQPLSAGIVDLFRSRGLKIFGPTKLAAKLEWSKSYAKEFMQKYNIPTAKYQVFSDLIAAKQYVNEQGAPIVIKADGLAAGKGVVVATTLEEAHLALENMLDENKLGAAGAQVVIEEFINGEEASFIVMSDGHNILPLASSQDHKRLLDGDIGPNTGGMGAYSPAPVVTPTIHSKIMRQIITPTIQGLAKEGIEYTGFLYAGVMITADGEVKTIEFNCRLGDPETQPILMRLKSDFLEIIEAAINRQLHTIDIKWDPRVALGVVMANSGYPDKPIIGDVLANLPSDNEEIKIFHAATKINNNQCVTSGGRVLCVTALGTNVKQAQMRANEICRQIKWNNCQFRQDIGHRAIRSYQN